MTDFEYYTYIEARRGTLLRQKTYFKDYHLTNNIFKDMGDYYTFTISKDDLPLWLIKFDNYIDLTSPQKFTWNPGLESVQGPDVYVYISNFREKECKLFVINFSNLTKLKISMEVAGLSEIKMYKLFCDLTGLDRSSLDNNSTNKYAKIFKDPLPDPYTYVCKPLQKVRLIDPDTPIYPIDIPESFADVIYNCISALNMHFDGYIFDPLLIDVTEDITDYYLNGWTSKIVLFKPLDFIDVKSKVVLKTKSLESQLGTPFTGYNVILTEIRRSLKKYEHASRFKILYGDIVNFCKKFNLKGDREVACNEIK